MGRRVKFDTVRNNLVNKRRCFLAYIHLYRRYYSQRECFMMGVISAWLLQQKVGDRLRLAIIAMKYSQAPVLNCIQIKQFLVEKIVGNFFGTNLSNCCTFHQEIITSVQMTVSTLESLIFLFIFLFYTKPMYDILIAVLSFLYST